MQNTDKGHHWAIIVWQNMYEDHPDWKERIRSSCMRFCISPLHDKDIWTNDDLIRHPDMEDFIHEHMGEPKKPHYHVMLHPDENTTFKTMKEVVHGFGIGVEYPFVLRSPYGYYHYLTHDYNPEKAQYDCNDIRHYNGSEPSDYLMDLPKAEVVRYKNNLRKLITEKRCLTFGEMEDVAEAMKDPNYQYIFQNNVNYFKNYLVDNLKKAGTYRREKV